MAAERHGHGMLCVNPPLRYVAGRPEADGHLQDAVCQSVCRVSPECSCCDHSTGFLPRRWRGSTALWLCVRLLATGVPQTRYVLERGCGMRALLGCYAAQICSLLPSFRDNLSVSYSMSSSPRPLKVGPTGCPETSLRNY
jgi:hypothetical protein